MNVLHLSDIHFGRNYPRYHLPDPFDRHQDLLDRLIETVSGLSDDMKPEHIVFTGDTAWHGKVDEYDEAYRFFSRLLSALGLTGNDISFCVGNHDVDTMYTCIPEAIDNYDIEKIDSCYKYDNIHLFNPKLQAFNDFCHRLGVTPYCYPAGDEMRYSYAVGFKDVPFKNGKKIRLYSFNTAMLFGSRNIKEDMMWLGKPQVDSLMKYGYMPAGDDIWYSIALFHHSDRFLHPNENYTYDGRDATLPLIMGNVDLLLCGHSESSDKPRFTSQVGGAKMILSGATYYNDVHTNTFSEIYISDRKKSCVFFPYIWKDNTWQDYDFMPLKESEPDCMKIREASGCRGSRLTLLRDDGEKYVIDLEMAEKDENGIHNYSDLFNAFHFHCAENTLKLFINRNSERYLDFMIKYDECRSFCCRGNISFVIEDCCGVKLAEGGSVIFMTECVLPKRDMVLSLRRIEDEYGVRIYIPQGEITQTEKKDIKFLNGIQSLHHDFHPSHRKERRIELSKEEMEKIRADYLESDGNIFIHDVVKNIVIHLFTTDINVGDVDVYRGPYHMDYDELESKIGTYCDGDRRILTFTGDDDLMTYAISSRYIDDEPFQAKNKVIIENVGK